MLLEGVFTKTLRDHWRAIVGWSVGLALMTAIELAVFPSVQDQAQEMRRLVESYPEAMRAFLGMTADFINRLELDDMNLTKFTPFPGSPLYRTIHDEGVFEERWDLMNCMNFVFVPQAISSRERLDELYRDIVRNFYTGRNWVRKFPGLMLKSPDSVRRVVGNLPALLKIRKEFS